MGKYDPWDGFFADLDGDELRFSLDDLEELTGVDLPPSARTRPEWWSSGHSHAKWKEHGCSVKAGVNSLRPVLSVSRPQPPPQRACG